jgi:hypothetical protein
MNNAIKESAANQKSEMAELWKKVKKADDSNEILSNMVLDLKEGVSNYKDDMFTFND